jgi:hypothetical protein
MRETGLPDYGELHPKRGRERDSGTSFPSEMQGQTSPVPKVIENQWSDPIDRGDQQRGSTMHWGLLRSPK